MSSSNIQKVIADWLPTGLCLAAATTTEDLHGDLLHSPAERAHVHNFKSERRLQEYVAGRLAAYEALAHFEATEPVAVPTSDCGAPVWPEGFSGSISHTHDLAIALVAPQNYARYIGIDIEKQTRTISERVGRRISSEGERSFIASSEDFTILHLFAAKECVYKALYPSVQRFFGFQAASILSATDSTITARLEESLNAEFTEGTLLKLHYGLWNDFLITILAF